MTDQHKEYRIEGRPPTIFKIMNREDKPYVVMDRRPLENKNLSYKAKGILGYLLSRPDGWEVNVPDLVNRATDGVRAIRSGLKELREAGHIRYNPTRQGNRIKKWVIEVYEVPSLNPEYGKSLVQDEFDRFLDNDFELIQNVQVQNVHEEKSTQVLSKLNSNERNKERFAKIANALSYITGGGLNANAAPLIAEWLDKHSDEWILKAIELAKEKGGQSANYVDRILINWEAKGYPKSRTERVLSAKKQKTTDAKQAAHLKLKGMAKHDN